MRAASSAAPPIRDSLASSSRARRVDAKVAAPPQELSAAPPVDYSSSARLHFLNTNRVVAVLEKAVERLQLLSLLDTTAARDGVEDASSSLTLGRAAAVLEGSADAAVDQRQLADAVTAALQTSLHQNVGSQRTVGNLFAEQDELERRYGALLEAANTVAPGDDAAAGDGGLHLSCFRRVRSPEKTELQEQLQAVSARLRAHHRALYTQLKEHPSDRDNWQKICNERQDLILLLQSTIEELTAGYREAYRTPQPDDMRGIDASLRHSGAGADSDSHSQSTGSTALKLFGNTMQMRSSLRTSVRQPRIPLTSSYATFAQKIYDEEAAQKWVEVLVQKEKEMNQNVKQLQSDLQRERGMKEAEVAERTKHLAQLRAEFFTFKRHLQEQHNTMEARAAAATEALQREATNKERAITAGVAEDQAWLRSEESAFRTFAAHLKERAAAMDALAAAWEQKNRTKIKLVESKKIDAEQTRQRCAERLEDCLREEERQLQQQREREAKIEADRKALEAQQQRKQEEFAAASVLEAALKAMLTRQALAKQMKGGKKKKKSVS